MALGTDAIVFDLRYQKRLQLHLVENFQVGEHAAQPSELRQRPHLGLPVSRPGLPQRVERPVRPRYGLHRHYQLARSFWHD